MAGDFALADKATLVLVHEFDRVFDRDDVRLLAQVYLMNQSCQSCALPGTRRTRYQNQALRNIDEIGKLFGQIKFVNRLDVFGYETKAGGDAVALREHVDAKTA